jgi:hypothetical protein
MTMEEFKPGDRVFHKTFGLGTVVERESADVIVVIFPQAGRKRLSVKHAPLTRPTDEQADALMPGGTAYQKWIEETFVFEGEEEKHYLGTHWRPFFDDARAIVDRLPEILPKSLLQLSYAEVYPPLRAIPPHWPTATYRSWPIRRSGITLVTTKDTAGGVARLSSMFPFDTDGIQTELVIEKVRVWSSGVEAQIECDVGGASIAFFDTLFAENRGWYEAGKTYQFILGAFAYICRPAPNRVLQAFNPKLTEEIKSQHPDIAATWPKGDTIPVHTKGMASLIPAPEMDIDEFWFHGPVTSIEDMEILGQPVWRIRTTVLRELEHGRDQDISIIVTRKVWGDAPPLQPGDDIEGTCWLQGSLWCPGTGVPLGS